MRYWLAGAALEEEAKRLDRPLTVVDLGCEKGWLKQFTPEGTVEEWIGLDWNPRQQELAAAGYDQVLQTNFDLPLPLESGSVDAVVSLHVFEHLPRPGATAAEVSRLLKPGGIFFAGAPTMPSIFATFREKWFRHCLKTGRITPGGHINSISPARWKRLGYEVGLTTEFVTGSHMIRFTGSFLESQRWWIRLNQLWGACFPALGSECFVLARRNLPWIAAAAPLGGRQTLVIRPLRVAGVAAAAMAVLFFMAVVLGLVTDRDARPTGRKSLVEWVALQQDGNDIFYVHQQWLTPELALRDDVHPLRNLDDVDHSDTADPHLLLSAETAGKWAELLARQGFSVASHMAISGQSYYLLERLDAPPDLWHFFNSP